VLYDDDKINKKLIADEIANVNFWRRHRIRTTKGKKKTKTNS